LGGILIVCDISKRSQCTRTGVKVVAAGEQEQTLAVKQNGQKVAVVTLTFQNLPFNPFRDFGCGRHDHNDSERILDAATDFLGEQAAPGQIEVEPDR